MGLLLILVILSVANRLAVAAGLSVGLAGAGLTAFALRGNPLAARLMGAGLSCLVLGAAAVQPASPNDASGEASHGRGSLRSGLGGLLFGSPAPRTIPAFEGETSRDPLAQMTALVHLMEAIRDESSLQEMGPRILKQFGAMLQAEADGLRVAPHQRAQVEQALPQFDQRMVAASERLEIIPGGRELQRSLVKLLQERHAATLSVDGPTGAAGPMGQGNAGSLPTIASWVVWGWATPPPPESAEDRRQRRKVVEAAGRNPDTILIYIRGVTSESIVGTLRGKVLEATGGIVLTPFMPGEVREFLGGEIKDFCEAAYRLDVGPVVKIEHDKAVLHVQLDPSELFVRPREWVDGPIPLLDFQKAGIPAASSVFLPDPPEPADLHALREDVRWDAGQNLGGVELVLHGCSGDMNRRVFQWLVDRNLGKGVRTQNAGFRPGTIHCNDVGDMRVFARKLDFGTIIRYDDRNGVIHLVVDPARLDEA